jgi:protein phosphatase
MKLIVIMTFFIQIKHVEKLMKGYVMYDIIGDVHGCYEELITLIERMGYVKEGSLFVHPKQRQLVFVGDLTDRGPKSLAVLQLVASLVKQHRALYVPGNHCDKLYRYLLGRRVQIKHGLETTVAELNAESKETREPLSQAFVQLYKQSSFYLLLDDGKLIVSHAGIKEELIGKQNEKVKSFCLYGDVTGEKDENGFPVRRDWAQHYKGARWIVYGHTPVKAPRFVNRTVNIDTGCVFGGYLTGLQYPEMKVTLVSSSMPYVATKFYYINPS